MSAKDTVDGEESLLEVRSLYRLHLGIYLWFCCTAKGVSPIDSITDSYSI